MKGAQGEKGEDDSMKSRPAAARKLDLEALAAVASSIRLLTADAVEKSTT